MVWAPLIPRRPDGSARAGLVLALGLVPLAAIALFGPGALGVVVGAAAHLALGVMLVAHRAHPEGTRLEPVGSGWVVQQGGSVVEALAASLVPALVGWPPVLAAGMLLAGSWPAWQLLGLVAGIGVLDWLAMAVLSHLWRSRSGLWVDRMSRVVRVGRRDVPIEDIVDVLASETGLRLETLDGPVPVPLPLVGDQDRELLAVTLHRVFRAHGGCADGAIEDRERARAAVAHLEKAPERS